MKKWAEKILRVLERIAIWILGCIITMIIFGTIYFLTGCRFPKGPGGTKLFSEFYEDGQQYANRIADSIRNRKQIAERRRERRARKRAEMEAELQTKTIGEYIRDRIKYKYQRIRDDIKDSIEVAKIPPEEYEQMVFDKTPPEILIKAQEYEDNMEKLKEYLYPLQEQLGFNDSEMDTLCTICHNPIREQERIEEEKEKRKSLLF